MGYSPAISARPVLSLGVATHFEQGWPRNLLQSAREVAAVALRDDVSWQKSEAIPGQYDFSSSAGYVAEACNKGFDVLLVLDPRHLRYDGGHMVASPAGQLAFGRYVEALLDHVSSGCISGIEVGNEINSNSEMMGKDEQTAITAYANLLHVLRQAIHASHPDVAIVGGSTNMIGTGFLEALMKAGAFDAMDAVAVHPYRSVPENVDKEIEQLKAAMREHGVSRPIWATEFGDYFSAPDRAAPHLIKMAMLLFSSGVDRAYWYALRDEPEYPNMGLFDLVARMKPAGEAFRLAQAALLGGAPRRLAASTGRSFVYQLASGGYVLWGDPRPLVFETFISASDSRGRAIARPYTLSDDPIVLPPGTRFSLGDSDIVADSLLEYGDRPWFYAAQKKSEDAIMLRLLDSRWTSAYSAPGLQPLNITASTLTPAGESDSSTSAVVGYIAPGAQRLEVFACFSKKIGGDGLSVHVTADGKPVYDAIISQRTKIEGLNVTLPAKGRLAFAFSAAGAWGNEELTYRIQLTIPRAATAHAACLP